MILGGLGLQEAVRPASSGLLGFGVWDVPRLKERAGAVCPPLPSQGDKKINMGMLRPCLLGKEFDVSGTVKGPLSGLKEGGDLL